MLTYGLLDARDQEDCSLHIRRDGERCFLHYMALQRHVVIMLGPNIKIINKRFTSYPHNRILTDSLNSITGLLKLSLQFISSK